MRRLPIEDLEHVTEHAREAFLALRGARVLITGGTGFFGQWLVESVLYANRKLGLELEILLLTRRPERLRELAPWIAADSSVSLIEGDVRTFEIEAPVNFIIHAASESGSTLAWDAPAEMFDVIVRGTGNVLGVAKATGVRRMLYVSSGAVYGVQPPELSKLPETYAGAPDCLNFGQGYGNGKRTAEWLCSAAIARIGLECVIARPFAFIGPALPLDAHFAAGNFIRDALSGDEIKIGGDGTPYRTYLYTADLAVWLWTMLVFGQSGRAYNVGSPVAVSIKDLAEAVADVAGNKRVSVAKAPVPGVAPARYVPDVSRAQEELGLDMRISLVEGIAKMLRWHREAI